MDTDLVEEQKAMTCEPSRPVTRLPQAVIGGPGALSPDARRQVKALNGPQPWAFLRMTLLNWATIVGAVSVSVALDSLIVTLCAIFVVSSRQIALGFLLHEQVHHLAFRSKFGDLLCNLLIGYPLLVITTESYAQVHLSHHAYYFTDKDPDHRRKSGDEWVQPMPLTQFLRLAASDIVGLNLIKLIRGKTLGSDATLFKRRWEIPGWVRYAYFVGVAVVLTWTGSWRLFLLYWLLPSLTISQVLIRLGALCEHRYNLPEGDVKDSTPMIILPLWQRILLPRINFHYHIYHHFFPGVSFANLPKIHEIFVSEGLIREENLFRGYGDYVLRGVLQRRNVRPRQPA